ncbi:hypothetical protein A2U01_0011762, partial [Trifolium medium]|nr:hypothetical protein [Trifolium medium]
NAKATDDDDDVDDASSVDISKSQKQLLDNNTGIKSNPIDFPSFAVDQHNFKENANLKFVRMLDMKTNWIKTGWLYHIILEAKDGEK